MGYKLYKGKSLIKNISIPINIRFNANDNYIKVGNPTIANNIVSGFSTSNYLTLKDDLIIGKFNYEIIIKFKAGTQYDETNYHVLYYQNPYVLSFCLHNYNNGFQLHSNTGDGSKWNTALNGTTEIPEGKIGWAKFVRKNGIRSQYLSYDGINWTNEGSIADTNDIAGSKGFFGGALTNINTDKQINNGSIYLAESIFKLKVLKEVNKIYKQSTLVYSKFEAPLINQPVFTSNTTDGITIDDHLHRSNLYNLFNGVSTKYNTGLWTECWFSIAYPQEVVVSSYKIVFGPATQQPYEWYLQACNDNINWIDIHHITNQNHEDYTSQTYNSNLSFGNKYKYYRLKFINGVISSSTGALKQIQFYTTKY